MKKTFQLAFCLLISFPIFSQAFIPAFDRFSGKEPAYITLTNGTQIEGIIDDIDRKKGLIEEITLKDANKKKQSFKPEQMRSMYLPASGYNKSVSGYEQGTNVRKWRNNAVNTEIINKGYAYFEQSSVVINGDIKILMLQLLNPTFSSRIKVFHDPLAAETMRIGFGGLTVAGGDDKSYFIKIEDKPAFKIKRRDYEDNFRQIYVGCPDFYQKVGKETGWQNFAKHVADYTEMCD